MSIKKQKIYNKIYIEETLKNRKYLSFRLDLIMIKVIVSALFFIVIFTRTNSLWFAILMTVQIFLLFSLVNKKIMDRRKEKGEKVVLDKYKKNYFERKIFKMTDIEFADYIKLILEKTDYEEIERIDNKYAIGYKDGTKRLIRIFHMYKGAVINATDIRDVISRTIKCKYECIVLIMPHEMTEDAKDILANSKELIKIDIFDINELYSLTNNLKLLPKSINNYEEIKKVKTRKERFKIIESNIFSSKKIIIYALAALFFYITGKITYFNTYNIYFSYYFIFLIIINISYNIIKNIIKNNKNLKSN